MNLKKLLMLVTGTVLVVPTTLSVVACQEPIQHKKIDSVITKLNLEEIIIPSSDGNTIPSKDEVLEAIDKINNIKLSTKDVEITAIDANTAAVKGIGDYDGTINVKFTTKVEKNIDKVIQTKDLDVITIPSSEERNIPSVDEVLTAINTVNNIKLSTKDVEITVKDDQNATVKGLGDYDGTINVKFTTNVQKNIDKVIQTKDLGEITIPSSEERNIPSTDEVLEAINSANNIKLSAKDVEITAIDANTAIVTGIGDYDGTINVKFTTKVEKNIDKVIKTKDLDVITIPSSEERNIPSKDEVLTAINTVNNIKLSTKDVEITAIDANNATVKGIGDYDGTINVKFTTNVQKNIASAIQTKDLDVITIPSSEERNIPSKDEVLTAINTVNNIKLSTKDVEITAIDANNATVKGIGDYDGTINVKFTTNVQKNIASAIQTKDLDVITIPSSEERNIPSEQQVLTAINNANKGLNLKEQDVVINNITATGADVAGNDNYDSSTTVNFTTNVQKNIASAIQTKDLDVITIPSSEERNIPSVDEVLTAINSANKELSLKEKDVVINNITATGADIAGNDNYDSSTTVTFTTNVQKNIASAIQTKDLGNIFTKGSKKPTVKAVLHAINDANEGLNLKEQDVTITINDNGSATVTGINNYDSSTTVTFTTNK